MYDADGDGALAGDELKSVPGIASAVRAYDSDGDQRVSEQEIVDRLKLWREQGLGFRPLTIYFTLDGQPLDNVDVKLAPEPYLGDVVKPAYGTTRGDGSVTLSVTQDDLPPALKARGVPLYGVTGGTYKIVLTGGDRTLPAQFNDATEVGVEVAVDLIKAAHYVNLSSR